MLLKYFCFQTSLAAFSLLKFIIQCVAVIVNKFGQYDPYLIEE